jgi:hypothetical protein
MKIFLLLSLFFSVAISHGQKFKKLDSILSKQLTPNQNEGEGGKWVYYRKYAKSQPIHKPEVNKLLSKFKFYTVNLTNYLDEHVETSRCLILFDTVKRRILLVEPMWCSDQNETFLKLFIGVKFKDRITLMKIITELQSLLIVGFEGKFANTKYYDNKVTFDLTEINNGKIDIWRSTEIAISDNVIKSFKSTNPKMNDSRIVQ